MAKLKDTRGRRSRPLTKSRQMRRKAGDIWQGILGIGQISANDDFTALVEIRCWPADRGQYFRHFQVEFAVESFYRRPTVRRGGNSAETPRGDGRRGRPGTTYLCIRRIAEE